MSQAHRPPFEGDEIQLSFQMPFQMPKHTYYLLYTHLVTYNPGGYDAQPRTPKASS